MNYPIIDVSNWEVVGEEHPGYIGEREKEWLRDPQTGKLVMFKIPRKDRGEHWAEKVCSELASALNFPCAKVDLAVRDGIYGCLSYFFVEKEKGSSHFDSGSFFPYEYIDGKIIYKIEVIEDFLWEYNLFSDFIYIIFFDALIANGDRHQDNWGITRNEIEDKISISPMYDNSASLARELSRRNIEIYNKSGNDLLRYIYKGKSKIGLNEVRAANHFSLIRYLRNKYPIKIEELINCMNVLKDNIVFEIVDKIPESILDKEYKQVVINFIKYRRDILKNIGDDMDKNIKELFLVWKEPVTRQRYLVGKLIYEIESNSYIFSYLKDEIEKAVSNGFKNYPSFPDISQVYKIQGSLFPGVINRLPNRKRSNYPEILMKYNLDPTSSEMEILAATRGRLGTDNFEFVPVIQFVPNLPFQVTFDLAGARRYDFPSLKHDIKESESVSLVRHIENEIDDNAVKVMYKENLCLGFVPKYYSKEITEMLKSGREYKAKIKKLDADNKNPDEWAKIEVEAL